MNTTTYHNFDLIPEVKAQSLDELLEANRRLKEENKMLMSSIIKYSQHTRLCANGIFGEYYTCSCDLDRLIKWIKEQQ